MHPLVDLTAEEIERAAGLVRKLHREQPLVFKAVTLEEPQKHLVLEYLKAERNGSKVPSVPRLAFTAYYLKGTVCGISMLLKMQHPKNVQNAFITTYVNLTTNSIESTEKMSPKYHGNVDFNEVGHVEELTLRDPQVVAEIAKLNLPDHLHVIAEAWGFGSDGVADRERQYQVYMFVGEKKNPDSNHYARPLAFSPVVDTVLMKVIRIDYIPTGPDHNTHETQPWHFVQPNEYVPEALKLREDLRPLQVTQPEGTSYSITPDNVLSWQKWQFRVSFNYREGLLLRDIRYEDRPIFYRISLSEMTVPYADPRSPYHRKQAFDLGDVGAGLVANNLSLGCDCLGSITYLDGLVASPDGKPLVKKNAICIHEQDNGIGWKHSNYRTERKKIMRLSILYVMLLTIIGACVVRNRELVIQQILTVSNYE